MRKLLRRPSPGVLLAIVAIVLSSVGSATAALSIGSNQIRNNSIRSKDIRNGSLRAVDFRPGTLRPGPVGAAGPSGPAGPAGPAGPPGAAGAARAYGYVDADGTLSRSRGVTSVSQPVEGIYCIHVDDAIDRSTTI